MVRTEVNASVGDIVWWAACGLEQVSTPLLSCMVSVYSVSPPP